MLFNVSTLLGEPDFGLAASPEAQSPLRRIPDRFNNFRMGVTGDRRTPASNEIDIAVAIHIEDVGTLGRFDKDGLPAHRAERPHRAVDTAHEDTPGVIKCGFRSCSIADGVHKVQ